MVTARKTTRWVLALTLLLALSVLAMGKLASADVAGPPSEEQDITPTLVPGNPTCKTQGFDYELKIQGAAPNGTYFDDMQHADEPIFTGPLSVTISNSDGLLFDWDSNIGVDQVIVKASDNADAFVYDPGNGEVQSDTRLHGPVKDDGTYRNISHVSFCYDLNLQVEKTANTSLKRTHTWTIDKSADKDKVTLPVGGTSPVNYSVKVDETPKDSDWKVDGTITVTAPVDATVTSVTDVISGGITETNVQCSEPLPAALNAGESLTCTYSANLPDATTRTNTATATSGTTGVNDGTDTAQVNFANATVEEIDEQINVKDSLQGNLGTATADKTFNYTRNVGPYEQCGNYKVPNTASFTTNDTPAKGEDSWNVDVTVLCKVTVKKTVDGVVNPNSSIDFTLTGPGLPPPGSITLNTKDDQDGILDFGYTLVPGQKYTLCENPVPAGFTSFWKLDGVIVTPYNPGDSKVPQEDIGVRCYDFTASAGKTPAFEIDNSHPGGDPRTIGYWKNWNTCTSGNQATTAAKNGGAAAGFFLLNDLLPQLVGDFKVTTCAQGIKVLSKQDQKGTNQAKDAAYELAAQLLAAKLNLAAGAETCSNVQTAVMNGQALLDQINFTGSGSYLVKSSTNRTNALNLATQLDKYNNGDLC